MSGNAPEVSWLHVTYSTNVEEVLVKLITCSDVPGRWVDVWRLCDSYTNLSQKGCVYWKRFLCDVDQGG